MLHWSNFWCNVSKPSRSKSALVSNFVSNIEIWWEFSPCVRCLRIGYYFRSTEHIKWLSLSPTLLPLSFDWTSPKVVIRSLKPIRILLTQLSRMHQHLPPFPHNISIKSFFLPVYYFLRRELFRISCRSLLNFQSSHLS